MEWLSSEFRQIGFETYRLHKGTLRVTIPGRNHSDARVLAAHVDTLGAMVSGFKGSGRLRFTLVGGPLLNELEGENISITTGCGKTYTGTILTTKEAVHVYGEESRKLDRKTDNMEIRLDEKVTSEAETRALGIAIGDYVSFDPRTVVTESGFVKTRHLDDKASVAVLLAVARHLKQNGIAPAHDTYFLVTGHEEVGHGGAAGIPEGVTEFLAVDMGCIRDNLEGSEYKISICPKDSTGPYDQELFRRLIALAQAKGISYALDVFPYYGSDAGVALRAGYDVKTGLIGTGVDASHSYERTHQEGLANTAELALAYMLSD
jgi:putative aminopeptidase FrvX